MGSGSPPLATYQNPVAGRDPAIHGSHARRRTGRKTWMPGSGPGKVWEVARHRWPPNKTPWPGVTRQSTVPPHVGGRRKTWMPGSGPGKGWKGGSHPLNFRQPDLAPRQVDARLIKSASAQVG